MNRRSAFRSLVSVLAVAAAVMAVGISSAPANASVGSMSASLSITRAGNGYSSVTVTGTVKMTQAEAQSYISSNHRIQWRLWGEDTFSDDFLYGPDPASLTATSKGLEYKGQAVMRNSVLNEDWGFDEVYAGVRFIKPYPNSSTIRSAQSNTFWGDF
jgi:hypothetical protein